ncbi:MAG: hypothetical protein EOP42_27765 [Sphingobacteriaceae bacterium]|nr:MAG: hypothetical protein EOP42_27765 [Sphingobacteriaceae bacterium]
MTEADFLREKYKPETIKLLFVGESPSVGEKFFYAANSNLYRAIKAGFEDALKTKFSAAGFLDYFRNSGCFLDHLCLISAKGLDLKTKKSERIKGIQPLCIKLKIYQPKGIVILMKGIEPQVKQAIEAAGLTTINFVLTAPFPAHSEVNRLGCMAKVSEAVTLASTQNILLKAQS